MQNSKTDVDFSTYRINELRKRGYDGLPIGVMIVGHTGAGKSSTINALFQKDVAAVGSGTDPKTKDTSCFSLNKYLKLFDTPGLGDSPYEDVKHKQKIVDLLEQNYTECGIVFGKLIDIVLVILDGSTRDIGTTIQMIPDCIMNHIRHENIFFAINQADIAMKGRHFDNENQIPDEVLGDFLEEKAESMQRRVYESTGLRINKPICYSATNNFNITSLIDLIIDDYHWRMRKGSICFSNSQNNEMVVERNVRNVGVIGSPNNEMIVERNVRNVGVTGSPLSDFLSIFFNFFNC